jgi:hypothetical protein
MKTLTRGYLDAVRRPFPNDKLLPILQTFRNFVPRSFQNVIPSRADGEGPPKSLAVINTQPTDAPSLDALR